MKQTSERDADQFIREVVRIRGAGEVEVKVKTKVKSF
jgi:hypothetical protein